MRQRESDALSLIHNTYVNVIGSGKRDHLEQKLFFELRSYSPVKSYYPAII